MVGEFLKILLYILYQSIDFFLKLDYDENRETYGMKNIQLGDTEYRLVKNYKDGFCFEDLEARYTDYFMDFDYIFGDYSYDKLRLKGFCRKENKKCSSINTIDFLESYIEDYCAFECRYFLLEKVVSKKTLENS